MYDLSGYSSMLRDSVRLQAFRRALEEVVPGKQVLEIGGGTGFFACLASKLGAASVTSIELNSLIQWGPRTAVSNGLKNLRFVYGRSQDYRSDELADVLLHDLRGNTPYFENSLTTLLDARRLLKPEAVYIPRRDIVYACLVEDAPVYRDMEGVWGGALEGIDLTVARVEARHRLRYSPSSESRPWPSQVLTEIDYASFEKTYLKTDFAQVCQRDGLCHGLAIWFETFLTDTISFSNDPWLPKGKRGTTYGVTFLPWPEPVPLEKGVRYRVEVAISARGYVSGRLRLDEGTVRPTLGHFASSQREGDNALLPLRSRLQSQPTIKRYQQALEALEKGASVSQALQRIRQAGPKKCDEQTGLTVLLDTLNLVQGSHHRPKVQKKLLQFSSARLLLETWDRELQRTVLERLEPNWQARGRVKAEDPVISLEESAHLRGILFVVTYQGKRWLLETLEEALDTIESLLTEELLAKHPDFVVLDCAYFQTEDGATLVLGDDQNQREKLIANHGARAWNSKVTILDRQGRLLTYHAQAGSEAPGQAAPVTAIVTTSEQALSPAAIATLLIGRSRSNRSLENPFQYFQKLLASIDPSPKSSPASISGA